MENFLYSLEGLAEKPNRCRNKIQEVEKKSEGYILFHRIGCDREVVAPFAHPSLSRCSSPGKHPLFLYVVLFCSWSRLDGLRVKNFRCMPLVCSLLFLTSMPAGICWLFELRNIVHGFLSELFEWIGRLVIVWGPHTFNEDGSAFFFFLLSILFFMELYLKWCWIFDTSFFILSPQVERMNRDVKIWDLAYGVVIVRSPYYTCGSSWWFCGSKTVQVRLLAKYAIDLRLGSWFSSVSKVFDFRKLIFIHFISALNAYLFAWIFMSNFTVVSCVAWVCSLLCSKL